MSSLIGRLLIGAFLIVTSSCAAATPASVAPSMAPSIAASAAATASPEPPATPASSPSDGVTIATVAEAILDVHGGPDFPVEAFGSLWVLAHGSEEPALVRIDPASNTEAARIPIAGRRCQGLGATDDAVWVCSDDGIERVDPTSNRIVSTVPIPVAEVASRFAVAGDAVWALGGESINPDLLVRLDPATETTEVIPLGHRAGTIAFGFDALWVTAPASDVLLRIDPATREITEHASGLEEPWTVVAGPDALWVTLHGFESREVAVDEPTVVRVDPVDGASVEQIATGAPAGYGGGVFASDDRIWVRAWDRFLVGIDPATNTVVERYSGPSGHGDVIVAFGSVWATSVDTYEIFRLAP